MAVPPPPGLGAVVPDAAETLPRDSEEPSSRTGGILTPSALNPSPKDLDGPLASLLGSETT